MNYGLVERLRNGGQADLADMAEGLVKALKELLAESVHFTSTEGEQAARAAIAAAEPSLGHQVAEVINQRRTE